MTSPVSLPSGTKLLASHFDAYENLTAALVTYNPSFLASGVAPALGNGSLIGRYRQSGLDVFLQVLFTAGSSTTYGTGFLAFGLPGVANNALTEAIGSAYVYDTSANAYYVGAAISPNAQGFVKVVTNSGEVGAGGTNPFTFATGDKISLNIRLQA